MMLVFANDLKNRYMSKSVQQKIEINLCGENAR